MDFASTWLILKLRERLKPRLTDQPTRNDRNSVIWGIRCSLEALTQTLCMAAKNHSRAPHQINQKCWRLKALECRCSMRPVWAFLCFIHWYWFYFSNLTQPCFCDSKRAERGVKSNHQLPNRENRLRLITIDHANVHRTFAINFAVPSLSPLSVPLLLLGLGRHCVCGLELAC